MATGMSSSVDPNPIETEDATIVEEEGVAEEGAEEEQGECGFCLFMKGGGCKEAFIAWEECVEHAEKNKEDIVEKCFEVTSNLKKCMDAHYDYYEPILRAEKMAEEELNKEVNENRSKSDGMKDDVVVEKTEIVVEGGSVVPEEKFAVNEGKVSRSTA